MSMWNIFEQSCPVSYLHPQTPHTQTNNVKLVLNSAGNKADSSKETAE